MPTNQNNNEEEVDLGSLFVIIGRGFSTLFNFIGTFFKFIFLSVIKALVFLKKNFRPIGIAVIIGGVIGGVKEFNKENLFYSQLVLEPNFKSTRQLYNNVNYYNDLVKQKDTAILQKIFNLEMSVAASLRKFQIQPVQIDSDIINSYNSLILSLDTLSVKSFGYESFKESFTNYDYKFHRITVRAEKNDVFDKLADVIISSVVNNNYFNRIKTITNKNLNRTDSLYRQNLIQVDTLRNVYMKVMIEESKKQTSGTSIDLGGQKSKTKEIDLFETNRKINQDLEEIAIKKSTEYDVINIISNFQPIGTKINFITENYIFLFGALGGGFMIFWLLLRQLNTYLENYKQQ
ncbi:MAG: hypothetical protein P8Q33_01040 [Polaribacter sp.]|nr:hypothetical protein [Polaribacter sp.]